MGLVGGNGDGRFVGGNAGSVESMTFLKDTKDPEEVLGVHGSSLLLAFHIGFSCECCSGTMKGGPGSPLPPLSQQRV